MFTLLFYLNPGQTAHRKKILLLTLMSFAALC